MSAQLLNCPFCGGEAMFENDGGRWSVGCIDASGECYGFQSLTTFARQAAAIAAWNTRAPNAAAEGLAKALEAHDAAQAALDEADEHAHRADAEGWRHDPTGSGWVAESYDRANKLFDTAAELRRTALAAYRAGQPS